MRKATVLIKVILFSIGLIFLVATGTGVFAGQCASYDPSASTAFIPCLNLWGTSYWVNLSVVPEGFQVTSYGDYGKSGDGAQCALYDGLLHIPCVSVGGQDYWADLAVISTNPYTLDINTFGAKSSKIGVVVMHGNYAPYPQNATKYLGRMLADAGFIVITPDMPYSADRQFDKTLQDTLFEIDDYVAELQRQGAAKIFIAGHSLGGSTAIYYGTRATVDGIIAIGPGFHPQDASYQSRLGDSVTRAEQMIAAGNGNEKADFIDYDSSYTPPSFTIYTTAVDYFSWFNPQSQVNAPQNTPMLIPGTPLMWVVGTQDQVYFRYGDTVFNTAPANPNNTYVVVDADHDHTPIVATPQIIQWLQRFVSQ